MKKEGTGKTAKKPLPAKKKSAVSTGKTNRPVKKAVSKPKNTKKPAAKTTKELIPAKKPEKEKTTANLNIESNQKHPDSNLPRRPLIVFPK